MKKLLTIASAVALIAVLNNAAWASSGPKDLVKMARSGVDEEVFIAFINASPDTFGLNAEDIITLKDLGVSSKVIIEALRHGHDIDTAAARETMREAADDPSAAPASSDLSTASAVAPPTDRPNISFFYESLYPYGNWLEIDGGWCWQPNATIIDADWAPYCNRGHWVWSDWGWCWVSDYSWGWAPFHYGRWFHHRRHGWCWAPDTDWGPAWVSWRRGDDYCGWAPLPPRTRYVDRDGFYYRGSRVSVDFEFNLTFNDYHFVPVSSFCDPHPWVHMVPRGRAEETYRRTVFVKNGYGFGHDHIINNGLPIEDITRSSGRTITSITIVHDKIRPGEPIHRGMVRENRLVIYKPVISRDAPENPSVIKSRLEKMRPREKQDKEIIKREKDAVKQTVRIKREAADNAKREMDGFEKAAKNETDAVKKAELQGEAEVRAMRVQQARDHVTLIKKWKPSQASPALPQSRMVPQPLPENQEQVQTQVRFQVQQEARQENQRQQAAEQMIRTPWGRQLRVEQPRVEQPPQQEQQKVERNNDAPRRGQEKSDNNSRKKPDR